MTGRRGFSLIEVMVAVTILGLFMLGLAKANFVIARKFYPISGGASRDAEIAGQINEFTAMPYDTLPKRVGSKTFSTLPWAFTRTVAVDTSNSKYRKVTLTFTPTNSVFKSYTFVLYRGKPTVTNPL